MEITQITDNNGDNIDNSGGNKGDNSGSQYNTISYPGLTSVIIVFQRP